MSDFKWVSYTILNYAKLRYPNTAVCRLTFDAKSFSSIPVRSFNLKGLKIKVPNAATYNPVTRVYTGADWDGNFTVAWSRNPAWILYDLVTNPRYGLGDLVNPIYQDKWSIFTIAKRCDELVLDGKGGQEHRYSLDLFLQSAESAKKVIQDIASVFDGMAYWGNKAVVFTQDSPKAVTKLFTPANVVKGMFNYTGSARQVRKTVALIQWNDPDDNYRVATEYVEDTSGLARYGYQEVSQAAIGCTSRGQAHRYGKRLLLTSRLETDVITFSVGLDGMGFNVGDRFRVADPLKNSNVTMGGRLLAGSTTQFINLDRNITLSSGINYKIALVNSSGEVIIGTVTNVAGAHNVISVFPLLSGVPETDTVFIIYNEAELDKTYRITSIIESSSENKSDGFYDIVGVEYNASKYTEIDDIHDLPALPPNPFINTSVVPPSGLTVSVGVYTALEGIRRYIDLSWSASTSQFLSHYNVVARLNGETVVDDKAYEQSYRILNPLIGDWEFTITAVTQIGKTSTEVTVTYTLGEMYLVEAVSITDLQIKGIAGTTFTGREVTLDWDTDALTVLGFSDTYSAGQGGQSPWFRDYQVDIKDGSTVLRTEYVTESEYTYTYEKNLADGLHRTITATIRARDLFGRYSQPGNITVSNPAPAAVSTVALHAGYKSILVEYTRPVDNDFAGVAIFLSTTSGFTPGPGNLVYSGGDASITIPNLLENTPYYLRIGAYDAFGSATSYTLSATEYTKTLSSISAPSPEDIKNGLQTALDDPNATPLVFDTDVFAVNLNGVDKTPFIIGVYQGNPAILMDADVAVTGSISASQIVGGRIASTEDIIVGNGNVRINGDGSIFTYNGADTLSNRDFAVFTGGTLSFQRYRGGQYREYKSVKRIEYGTANSGDTVTLPGYWDTQPRLIVSPYSLQSYNAVAGTQTQTWTIRGDNLTETSPGSGIWEFDAIAELNYASSAGTETVASSSGTLGVNSWTSAESVLPNNTVAITVSARFQSIRGNGTSTHGYLFRTVVWKVQGWNGSVWSDLATKTRNIAEAEHNQQIVDSQSLNIPAGTTKIRGVFTASDTNGTSYSRGIDEYTNGQESINLAGTSGTLLYGSGSATVTTPAWSPPFGDIYMMRYQASLSNSIVLHLATLTSYWYANGVLYRSAGLSGTGSTVASWSGSYDSGLITTSVYNRQYFAMSASANPSTTAERTNLNPTNITAYFRSLNTNSATPENNFTLQDYAWNISGSTAIALGSLNWMAIGD